MVNSVIKQERLDFRVDAEQKELIQMAAMLLGHKQTSSFAIATLVEKAREVVEQHRRTQLSLEDARRFVDILTAEEEPNAKLKSAFRKYKKESR